MKVKPRRAKRRPLLEAVIITEILILSLLGGVFISILIWNTP